MGTADLPGAAPSRGRPVDVLGHAGKRVAAAAPVAAAGLSLGVLAVVIASLPAEYRALAAAGALLPLFAVACRNARRLLFGLVLIDLPLGVDTVLNYRPEAEALGALGGTSLSMTSVAIGLLWILYLLDPDRATSRANGGGRVWWTAVPLGIYVLVVALSYVVAQDPELATFEIALVVQSFLLFAYVALTVRTHSDVIFIVAVLFVGLLLEGIVMIALAAGLPAIDVAGIRSRLDPGSPPRVGGTIGSPNDAGSYLALFAAPALAVAVSPAFGRALRRLAGAALLVGLVALALTFSRGGWLACAIALVLLLALGARRHRLALALPAVILLCALPFAGPILDRITADDGGAALSRVPLMEAALAIGSDHPLMGVGANNYVVALEEYRTPDRAEGWSYVVHNKYLLVFAETGIVALLAFISFLVAVVALGLRAHKSREPTLALLALGLTCGVMGHMVASGIETFHDRPSVQGLWLVAALVTAVSVMTRGTEARRIPPSPVRAPAPRRLRATPGL